MEARTVDYGSIGWTVNHLRHGHRMRRRAWREGAFVVLVTPDKSSPVTQRYFALRDPDGNQTVWSPDHADLLAADWLMNDPPAYGTSHATQEQMQSPSAQSQSAKPIDVEVVSTS